MYLGTYFVGGRRGVVCGPGLVRAGRVGQSALEVFARIVEFNIPIALAVIDPIALVGVVVDPVAREVERAELEIELGRRELRRGNILFGSCQCQWL